MLGFDSKQPNENPLQSTRAVKSVRCSLGRRTLFARLFRARLQFTIRRRTLLPICVQYIHTRRFGVHTTQTKLAEYYGLLGSV